MANVNARFIFENAGDDAVYSDGNSNVLSTQPLTNLTKVVRTKVVRTVDDTDLIINMNWGGDIKLMDGFGLMRHNLTTSGTIQLIIYDGQNQTGSILYDSGPIDAIPLKSLGDLYWGIDPLAAQLFSGWDDGAKFSTIWFDQVEALSVRVIVSDVGNPDTYLQVGRLIMGVASTPQLNVSLGLQNSWREDTKQTRSEGGSLRSDSKPQYREIDMTLGELDSGSRSGFFENVRFVGKRKDFLCSIFPELGGGTERDYTMQCKFSAMPTFVYWAEDTYRVNFKLTEV